MIQIRSLRKDFPADQKGQFQRVLDISSLEIGKGEFVSLLGPSGCGKTTLLRTLAGLEIPTQGQIFLQGRDVTHLPVQDRPIHTVFQKYALFPHLTVFENVAFSLRIRKISDSEIQKRVLEALAMVHMQDFSGRKPGSLSGGQSQRVALARAFVNRPELLLLDEPFSALDPQLRGEMQNELRELHKNLGITFIMVTHDRSEAFALSDRIAVMEKGQIRQYASPEEIYSRPNSLSSARISGDVFLLQLQGRFLQANGNYEFEIEAIAGASDPKLRGIKIQARLGDSRLFTASETLVMIRPEKLLFHSEALPSGIPIQVQQSVFVGDRTQLYFVLGSGQGKVFQAACLTNNRLSFNLNSKFYLSIPAEGAFFFPSTAEQVEECPN